MTQTNTPQANKSLLSLVAAASLQNSCGTVGGSGVTDVHLEVTPIPNRRIGRPGRCVGGSVTRLSGVEQSGTVNVANRHRALNFQPSNLLHARVENFAALNFPAITSLCSYRAAIR